MDNSTDCSYLSGEDLDRLSLARGVSGIVAFLGCCSTLLIMLLYRAFRSTLQRLFLYLTVAITAHSAMNVMQISSSNERYCKAVGFLNQYTMHIVLLLLFGATLYLSHRVRKSSPSRRKDTKPTQPKKGRTYSEVVFVIFSVVFPLTYNWIPFATDAYGGPPWCWLKVYVNDDCSIDSGVFLTGLFLGFIPLISIGIVSTTLVVTIVVAYFWWACRFKNAKEVRNKLWHEACVSLQLVVVLVTYFLYSFIFLIAYIRLYAEGADRDLYQDYPFGLLVANAVFLPLIQLVLPISFVIHLYSLKSEVRKAKQAWVTYFKSYSGKDENSHPGVEIHDQEETFQRSVHVDLPSTTCYIYQHEFSDEFLSSPVVSPTSPAQPPLGSRTM